MKNTFPENAYGVLQDTKIQNINEQKAEELKILGYTTLHSGYSFEEIKSLREEFFKIKNIYEKEYGLEYLVSIDEVDTIRCLLTQDKHQFLPLIFNQHLQNFLKLIFVGKYQLNQQNGIINPPQKKYNQGYWHRDLPYQHFVSSTPLAINALFCLDDFTIDNGATFVLPASHKIEAFPSEEFRINNAVQITAKAGSFIVLDCMVFHAGGYNQTNAPRCAINHVFNIPYFKQQIRIQESDLPKNLSIEQRAILGFGLSEPCSVDEYLKTRRIYVQ